MFIEDDGACSEQPCPILTNHSMVIPVGSRAFTNIPGGDERRGQPGGSLPVVQRRRSCYCSVLSSLPEAKLELLSQAQLICHCEAVGRASSRVGNRAGWRRPEELGMFVEGK